VFHTITFDGPDAAMTEPINAPPGRSRIDTRGKWKTNGIRGAFDIFSKKHCPPAPAFTIEKRQRLVGSSSGFTTAPLIGEIGQTVEYEIIVHNTGNVALVFSNLTDPNCDTIEGGPGGSPLAPGATPSLGGSATYTCKHVLTSAEQYENTATTTATPGQGPPISQTSNTVVVNTPAVNPHIYLGYVDGPHHPRPWKGDSGVSFIGCGFGGVDRCPTASGVDVYDAGAIRIDAPASGALSVTAASVTIGPCAYNPWPNLNVTVPAQGRLVLTQTGKHQCTSKGGTEQDNFDTSESFLKSPQYLQFLEKGGPCKNDGYLPAITLTINGHTVTLSDSGQVLNRGGVDPDICLHTTEAQNWVQLQ
jgi:hypothetical protein